MLVACWLLVAAARAAEPDGAWLLLGYSASEDASFWDDPDKAAVRERTATLDPPPANMGLGEMHYAGARVGSERHGLGVLTLGGSSTTTHDVHAGCFKRNRRTGYAVVEVFDERGQSSVYSGRYWNDLQHGSGVFQSGEDVYDGQWLFGQQWGRGRYSSAHWTYVGEWVRGEPHGQGVEVSAGVKHEGSWRHGKKEGAGRATRLSDGAVHVGVWRDGHPLK